MWIGKQVGVDQQPRVLSVEAGEHLADSRDPDLPLGEHCPPLGEEHTVGDGGVGVAVGLMVQTDHVSLGDKVEEDGGEESEEANESTESSLKGKALDSKSSFQEYLRHEEEAGAAGAVREELHP